MAPLFYSSSAAATTASLPLLPALLLLLVLGPASREVLAATLSTTFPPILRQLVPQLTNFNVVPYVTSDGGPAYPLVNVSTGGADVGAAGFCNLLSATGSLIQINTLSAGTMTSVFKLNATSTPVITFTFNLPGNAGVASIALGPISATFTTSSITTPQTGVPFTIPGSSIQSFTVTFTITIRVPASSTTGLTETFTVSGGSGSPSIPVTLAGFSCVVANAITCNTQLGIDLGARGAGLPPVSVNLGFSFTASASVQQGTDFTRK